MDAVVLHSIISTELQEKGFRMIKPKLRYKHMKYFCDNFIVLLA